MEKPIVYLVLGAPDSGRREIVADLVDGGLEPDAKPVVLVAASETDATAAVGRAEVVNWTWREDDIPGFEAVWPEAANVGFFIVEGSRSPVDQIEAFKGWLAAQGLELGRVITVFHCALVAKHEKLRHWYDACVHFSDVVLLNRREGVENKWISDLRTRFAKSYLPCLVEMVKKGRVANPALVLDLQVRRYSHWFDEEDAWMSMVDSDTEIMIEGEAGEPMDGDDEELGLEEDIYLARHPSGRRVKEVPNIRSVLAE